MIVKRDEKLVRDRRIIERQGSGKLAVACDAVRPRCSGKRQNQRRKDDHSERRGSAAHLDCSELSENRPSQDGENPKD